MILRDYCFAIIISSVILSYILYQLSKCMGDRRIKKLARELYSDVKKTLSEN